MPRRPERPGRVVLTLPARPAFDPVAPAVAYAALAAGTPTPHAVRVWRDLADALAVRAAAAGGLAIRATLAVRGRWRANTPGVAMLLAAHFGPDYRHAPRYELDGTRFADADDVARLFGGRAAREPTPAEPAPDGPLAY